MLLSYFFLITKFKRVLYAQYLLIYYLAHHEQISFVLSAQCLKMLLTYETINYTDKCINIRMTNSN